MSRGWNWIDEDAERTEQQVEHLTPVLDDLAAQWSGIHDRIEAEGFRRQAAVEDGEDPADHFETEDELQAWRVKDAARQELERMRLTNVETLLERHGARMMRPYEHWNEDESYMQYMECDRFGDSCC